MSYQRPPVVSVDERYGCLVIVAEAGRLSGKRAYLCLCDCGAEVVRVGREVKRKPPLSCRHCWGEHGHAMRGALTPTYRTWTAMLTRCTNPSQKCWPHYGGRGIAVCDRWRDFRSFLADMGERPEGRTLDRIDVDGNYESGNCRWATQSEQVRNRRAA